MAARIIPAHAGNTRGRQGRPGRGADHPRACGEHNGNDEEGLILDGSSPRMRGTRQNANCDPCPKRIIPAHAGNTGRQCDELFRRPDHPRACGEHGSTATATPPRNRDHPRACGEHVWPPLRSRPNIGSSPRMRGTPTGREAAHRPGRIIPAHAGNTHRRGPCASYSSDHPRACGEHPRSSRPGTGKRGSSPRMRGTPPGCRHSAWPLRIIPAHAGNTWSSKSVRIACPDHPRACGEHRA